MYTLARGEDEYSNLVPKASSVPSSGLYQNENDEFSYGSIDNISKTEPTTPAPVHRSSDGRNFVNLWDYCILYKLSFYYLLYWYVFFW